MSKTIERISQKKIRSTQVSLDEIKNFKKMLTKEGGFRYYKNRYNDFVSPHPAMRYNCYVDSVQCTSTTRSENY